MELIIASFATSFVLMLIAGGVAFSWINEIAQTRAEWRAMSPWIWKAALGGFFWPIGLCFGARWLWRDYWSKLPEK